MKNLTIFLFLILILSISSCTRDEKVINSYQDEWDMLMSLNTQPPALRLVKQPGGTIVNNDVYSSANQKSLTSPVRKMVGYREYIYALIPDENKIEVLDRLTFKIKTTIDFSPENGRPVDICFPDFTDAYIVLENANSVALFDVQNMVLTSRRFTVGKKPVAIACSGSGSTSLQNHGDVYVANQEDNTVTIINYVTRDVKATIPVSAAPAFVDFTSDGKKVVVVSLGTGKADSAEVKSAAVATLIDVESRSITKTKEIGLGAAKAIDQRPLSLSVTGSGWAFISTQGYLFRYDTKGGDRLVQIEKADYISAAYDFHKDKLLLLKKASGSTLAVIAEPTGGKMESSFTLPPEVLSLILL